MTGILPIGLLLALALTAGPLASGEPSASERSEQFDRNVDRAALSAQNKAVAKYRHLVKKHARTEQERPLRMRLLEALEGAANLEFRIAHGESYLRKRAVDYRKYWKALEAVIATASHLIRQAPVAPDVPRIYFVRAQAHGELKETDEAKRDYEFITKRFPRTPWAIKSNMALAGFATEATNHRLAIVHLKRVEEFPEDKLYPFALYQLAWSYFNLNEIPTGIDYLKRRIVYYKEKRDALPEKALSAAENTYLEHSLKDVVTFHFEGFLKKLPGYSLGQTLGTFRKIESGPYFGKMMVQFANLLRTRDLTDDLAAFQRDVIDEESDRPESVEMVAIHLDALLLRKAWDKVVTAAEGFKELDRKTNGKMREWEGYPKAQNLILAVASAVQKRIAATKDQAQSLKLSQILVGTYGAFTAIVEESDPRLPQIHYNLAETLYSIKEYDSATREYVWVLEHWQDKAGLKKAEVSLKAISSRYQTLDKQQLLPKDLKPKKLSESDDPELDDLKPLVGEWIKWVDEYLDDYGRTPKSFEQFEFEANRILYADGQTRAALDRMMDQVKAKPDSAVATGAASLVLDTYVFDSQWELLLEASERFLDMKKLGDAAFRKRLAPIPADASFKLLEASYKADDFARALKRAESFEEKFPKSPLMPDCLFLASRAAEKLQESEKALHYLSQLLTRFPKTDKKSVALLARASLEDTSFDFDAAARDYAEYLATEKNVKDRESILRRLFFVGWLSREPREPNCRDVGRSEELQLECDRFLALTALAKGETRLDLDDLTKKALSGPKENRALWAAVALAMNGKAAPAAGRKKSKPQRLGYRDRLSVAQTLATGVGDLDPLIQFSLVPVINRHIPEVFSTYREGLPRIASLKSSTDALARRIELIRVLENTAAKVVGLPWARVKISVLADVAKAYEDFTDELAKLAPPEGMTPEELAEYKKGLKEILDPFKEKGGSIRSQVRELIAEFPVRPADVAGFQAPERAIASQAENIDIALLRTVRGPDGDHYDRWEEAQKAESWARAGFFFQQIKDAGKLGDGTLSLMRAVSLAMAGAQPEAIGELETVLSGLDAGGKERVRRVIRSQYLASTATGKAGKYGEGK